MQMDGGFGQQPDVTTRVAAVACRYPAAPGNTTQGPEGFWASLQKGANLQAVVPAGRWDIDAYYAPDSAPK